MAKAGIVSLKQLREDAYVNFVKKVCPDNPIFPLIQSRIVHPSSDYCMCMFKSIIYHPTI